MTRFVQPAWIDAKRHCRQAKPLSFVRSAAAKCKDAARQDLAGSGSSRPSSVSLPLVVLARRARHGTFHCSSLRFSGMRGVGLVAYGAVGTPYA